ncbi:MAG: aminoacyl-tRNA hydrolase [Acidimicrobiaceae bacterium]|nr:aminoacyl-tRNA hydrolase [Acidimicrobiaceae bacterium]
MVLGLGNPGDRFLGTRHNLGCEVVEQFAEEVGASLRISRSDRARVATVNFSGLRVVLACPTTFMNLSGESAAPLIRRNGVEKVDRLIVVHDELDLEPGRVKVKLGGSGAGHNGLKSVRQHLGTEDFIRVRVGIGKPPNPQAGKDWVLKKPSKADRSFLDTAVQVGVDAIEKIIRDGVERAMNDVNGSAQ